MRLPTSIRFALRVHPVRRSLFAKVTAELLRALYAHDSSVFSTSTFRSYSSGRGKARKDCSSAQTKVASAFLTRYSELHGMPCPLGRGSEDGEPRRVLPSNSTVHSVHHSYLIEWKPLCTEALEHGLIDVLPDVAVELRRIEVFSEGKRFLLFLRNYLAQNGTRLWWRKEWTRKRTSRAQVNFWTWIPRVLLH